MALSGEQIRNARIVIAVGRQLGASTRDILIALMAAMQESGMRNLNYGDRDSIGMFQQRNAWGSRAARLNPYESARMFFKGGRAGQRGLLAVRNRNSMSLTQAAQAVQVSAFPNAYAKHEAVARSLLNLRPGEIPAGARGSQGGSGSFIRPVQGGRITQNFGDPPPRGASYARGFKNGMSFAAPMGTPVYAAGDGRVVRVASGGAYGNRIEIEHGGRRWTLYAHLSGTNVRPGQTVRAGQMIGRVGSTGQAFGAHLHFEVRTGANAFRSAVDPRSFLNMNGTPSAYIRDVNMTFTDIVPGQISADMGMMGPVESMMDARPYVYMDPFTVLSTETSKFPGMEDSFAGITDGIDRTFSSEIEEGANLPGGALEPTRQPQER